MLEHNSSVSSPVVDPATTMSSSRSALIEKMRAMYKADHQAEFLHLHNETDTLLNKLQTLKSQRQAKVN